MARSDKGRRGDMNTTRRLAALERNTLSTLQKSLVAIGRAHCTTAIASVAAIHLAVRIVETIDNPPDPYEAVRRVAKSMTVVTGEESPENNPPLDIKLRDIADMAKLFTDEVLKYSHAPAAIVRTLIHFAARLCIPGYVFVIIDSMKKRADDLKRLPPDLHSMFLTVLALQGVGTIHE